MFAFLGDLLRLALRDGIQHADGIAVHPGEGVTPVADRPRHAVADLADGLVVQVRAKERLPLAEGFLIG